MACASASEETPNGSGSAMRVKVVFDGTPAGTITLEDRLQYLPPVGGALL